MYNFFEIYPWYYGTFLAITISVAISLIGLTLVRSLKAGSLKQSHDVAGFTFGIIGVMYAVLLSFTVVSVQERFNEIQHNLDNEADILADLFRDAQIFPIETRDKIQVSLREYINAMAQYDTVQKDTFDSPLANTVENLWDAYYSFNPTTEQEKILYAESISKLNDFNRVRLLRLFAGKVSISLMMWSLLIFGAVLTTAFMYFFYLESFLVHALMTGMVAGLITFMLFFVFSVDSAFTGYVKVSTNHFQEISELYKRWDQKSEQPR